MIGGIKISEDSFQKLLKAMQQAEAEMDVNPMCSITPDQKAEDYDLDMGEGISETFGGEEEEE